MFVVLIVLQVLIAAALIGLILIQHGKGADMGAAFGSGASGTVFGSRGSGSFLTKATSILALLFFLNSLMLATPLVNQRGKQVAPSVTESIVPAEAPAPAEPAQPASDLPDVPGTGGESPK